jgi:hypothetical protein
VKILCSQAPVILLQRDILFKKLYNDTKRYQKTMRVDFNVHYHWNKFQKIMLIFAGCAEITSTGGQQNKLKNTSRQPVHRTG